MIVDHRPVDIAFASIALGVLVLVLVLVCLLSVPILALL